MHQTTLKLNRPFKNISKRKLRNAPCFDVLEIKMDDRLISMHKIELDTLLKTLS